MVAKKVLKEAFCGQFGIDFQSFYFQKVENFMIFREKNYQDVTVLQAFRHIRVPATMIQDESFDEFAFCLWPRKRNEKSEFQMKFPASFQYGQYPNIFSREPKFSCLFLNPNSNCSNLLNTTSLQQPEFCKQQFHGRLFSLFKFFLGKKHFKINLKVQD